MYGLSNLVNIDTVFNVEMWGTGECVTEGQGDLGKGTEERSFGVENEDLLSFTLI